MNQQKNALYPSEVHSPMEVEVKRLLRHPGDPDPGGEKRPLRLHAQPSG